MQKAIVHSGSSIKILVITGELSGELHAYHLVKALGRSLPGAVFTGIGGKKLQEAGMQIIYDYSTISVTGISEIFAKLKYIRQAYWAVKRYMAREHPSLTILVDFPGFNLRVAKLARSQSVPVVYFIPPQVWAWRKSRIRKIRERVNKVICILPFEKKLYEQYGVNAAYVGHPFLSTVKPQYSETEFWKKLGMKRENPVITLLPGSRENEVVKHMPVMLAVINNMAKKLSKMTILLPIAENVASGLVDKYLEGYPNIRILKAMSLDAMAYCDIAIAASGSVTLEAAILGTPTIVLYKISFLSYMLARMLVNVRYISLPNIIAGKEIFPEFIQQLDPEKIAEKALYMVKNGREMIRDDLQMVRNKLGTSNSYERAKDEILQFLEQTYGPLS